LKFFLRVTPSSPTFSFLPCPLVQMHSSRFFCLSLSFTSLFREILPFWHCIFLFPVGATRSGPSAFRTFLSSPGILSGRCTVADYRLPLRLCSGVPDEDQFCSPPRFLLLCDNPEEYGRRVPTASFPALEMNGFSLVLENARPSQIH